MPEFLTFSDINYDELLKEANICQDLDTQKEKLDCYKKKLKIVTLLHKLG